MRSLTVSQVASLPRASEGWGSSCRGRLVPVSGSRVRGRGNVGDEFVGVRNYADARRAKRRVLETGWTGTFQNT